jgi:hypothetical protein
MLNRIIDSIEIIAILQNQTIKMKKRILLLFVNFIAFNYLTFGQTTNQTRSVLYTLNQHEILVYNEAILKTNANGKNYALITRDTLLNKESFIYNGKKIIEVSNIDHDKNYLWLSQINLSKTNSYIVQYSINNKQYININGTNYGPYQEITAMGCKETEEYGFMYKLGIKYYLKFKDEKYGPFSDQHNDIFFADKNKVISNLYWTNFDLNPYTAVVSGSDYLEIVNSKSIHLNGIAQNYSEDLISIKSLYFNSINNFGFAARIKELDFDVMAIFVNGKVREEFFYPDDYRGFMLTEKDLYVMSKKEIKKNDVIIYTNLKTILSFYRKGNFLFETQDNKVFLNNQLLLNKPNSYIINAHISESGLDCAFVYRENDKDFVKTKKDEFGPYDNVQDLCFDNNGNLIFNFLKDNVFYNYKSGIIREDLGTVDFQDIFYDYEYNHSLKFKNHFFESSYQYDFVVIDGDSYGTSPALQSWIEPSTSSFKWTALENNEYVLYTYPI